MLFGSGFFDLPHDLDSRRVNGMGRYCLRMAPMPCSPVIFPPRAIAALYISSLTAGTKLSHRSGDYIVFEQIDMDVAVPGVPEADHPDLILCEISGPFRADRESRPRHHESSIWLKGFHA
jgi:hypothetical protein